MLHQLINLYRIILAHLALNDSVYRKISTEVVWCNYLSDIDKMRVFIYMSHFDALESKILAYDQYIANLKTTYIKFVREYRKVSYMWRNHESPKNMYNEIELKYSKIMIEYYATKRLYSNISKKKLSTAVSQFVSTNI